MARQYREHELRADRDALQARLDAAEAETETKAMHAALEKPWQRALESENLILLEDRNAALSLARRAQSKLSKAGSALQGKEEAEHRARQSRLEAHALEMDKAQLEVELARLQETHKATCRELQQAISRADEAETTLETATGQLASLRHFKEEAQGEFVRLQKQAEAMGELRLAKDRLERECESQRQVWTDLEKTRKQKSHLESQIAELTCAAGDRDILRHRVEELQGETRRLYAQLDVAQRDVDEYKRENLRLKIVEGEVSSLRAMQSEYQGLARERDAACYKAEKRESELLASHEKLERALEWERDARELRQDKVELHTLLESRQGEISDLKATRQHLQERLAHLHGVDMENDRLSAEVERLKAAMLAQEEASAQQVVDAERGREATAKLAKMENALAQLSVMEAPVGMGEDAMKLYISDAQKTIQFIVANAPERHGIEQVAGRFAPGKLKAWAARKKKPRPAG